MFDVVKHFSSCYINQKIGVFCLFIFLSYCFLLIYGKGYKYIALDYPKYIIVISALFIPALLIAVLNIKLLRRFLSLGLFRWLGNMSFSIYLWHHPLFLFVSIVHKHIDFNIESKKVILLVFAVVFVVSHFSYYFFEVPVQKFIRDKYYKYKAEKAEKSSSAL
jgi:peptidoglycan/LPS O-acetylase OafA/YrhL